MNLVNAAMKDTEVRSDQTCAEMIDRNNKILNEVMNQSESDKQKIVAKRSVDCSEQEKLKIDFQMHMIQSVRQVLNKSFFDLRVLSNVEWSLTRPGHGTNISSILGQNLHSLQVTPARSCV